MLYFTCNPVKAVACSELESTDSNHTQNLKVS